MTAMSAVVQTSARAVVRAGLTAFFARYLLADGYPMKAIKRTYLR
jgi:hypothetical protein